MLLHKFRMPDGTMQRAFCEVPPSRGDSVSIDCASYSVSMIEFVHDQVMGEEGGNIQLDHYYHLIKDSTIKTDGIQEEGTE